MSKEVFDVTTDILVVGSGSGALTGAYIAASRGYAVTIIESTDKFGGTSAYTPGAGIWLPGNQAQARTGLDDSIENALAYSRAVVGENDSVLMEAFMNASAPLVEELEKSPWIDFEYRPFPDYYHEAPNYMPAGRAIFPLEIDVSRFGDWVGDMRGSLTSDRLGLEEAEELFGGRALLARIMAAIQDTGNAELKLETAMQDLILDDGKVVGVVAISAGNELRISAQKGVLMAAGGFGQNTDMRKKYGNPGTAKTSMDAPGGMGRPIEAAVEAGAEIDLMDQSWWSPGVVHPDGTSTFTLGFSGGIFVDKEGNRFANESLPYDRLGRAILNCRTVNVPEEYFWFIFDGRFGDDPAALPCVPVLDSKSYMEAGLWKRADTLQELANLIGVPAESLVATVDRFNQFAATGVDEDFHRGENPYDKFWGQGQGPNSSLVPIEQGPFQAMAYNISDLGTKGGLKTDTESRVLRADGSVMPGLYAAGNTMASWTGETYPGPGVPIGSSMVFSYLAVLNMIKD